MTNCLAILSFVCVHNFQSMTYQDFGLRAEIDLKLQNGNATIFVRSDEIETLDRRRMNIKCEGRLCITYFKHCDRDGDRVTCHYAFLQQGESIGHELRLSAESSNEFSSAEQSIDILTRSDRRSGQMGLSQFIRESQESDPPHCRSGGPRPTCGPSDSEKL